VPSAVPPPTIPSVAPPLFSDAPVSAGPVRAIIEIHPSIRLSEDFSDNFNHSSSNKTSNFRTSVVPGLSLVANDPRFNGFMQGNVSESYDSANARLNTFYSLSGVLGAVLTPRLSLRLTEALLKTDTPGAADRLGLRTGRQTFTSNVTALTANYLIADVNTKAFYRFSHFSASTGLDTTSHAMGVNASKQIFMSDYVSLGYEYLDSRSTRPSNVEAASTLTTTTGLSVPTAGTKGHQGLASYSHQFTGTWSGGLSGSYAARTPQSSQTGTASPFTIWSISAFSSFTGGRLTMASNIGFSELTSDSGSQKTSITTFSSLVYALPRGTAALTLDRGFSETFASGENFGVLETQGVTGAFTYPLTPTATQIATAFYRDNKRTSLTVGDIATKCYGTALSVSAQLLHWLSLVTEYRHVEQSSPTLGTIPENRIRMSLTASF
jgi:hypothetical protein